MKPTIHNPSVPVHPPSSILHPRRHSAFTLIEMLVVIAIIGILAALIIGGAGYAITAGKKSRVNAERDALVTAIQSYKNKMGFYPPDNTNNPAQSSLFYELTGTTNDGGGANFHSSLSGETFSTSAAVSSLFNVGGFMNSSPDPNNVRNFAPSVAKSGGAGQLITSGLTNTLFGVPITGPSSSMMNTIGGKIFNPWHYVCTNPTNNQGTFDLWMDVLWGGKTNRISNWSPDPQVVSY